MTIVRNCFCPNLYQLRKPDFQIFSLQLYKLLSKSHLKAQNPYIGIRKMTFLYSYVAQVTVV